jgi:hypothetical protein
MNCKSCFDTGCHTGGIGLNCESCYAGCCSCEIGKAMTSGNSDVFEKMLERRNKESDYYNGKE